MNRKTNCQRSKQYSDPIICDQNFEENMSDAVQRKEQQKWTIKKANLDNARRLKYI